MATEKPCKLVILDMMLPLEDCLATLKGFRAARMTTPLLSLTASDSVEDVVATIETGSDDCLAKPFDLAELMRQRTAPYTNLDAVEGNSG